MARTSEQITIAKLYNALSNPSYDEIPPALWNAYSISMAHYLPAPLELPVTFYAADYAGLAWRHLSSQLEVVQVPGGHRGSLTIGAELLGDHLRQRIDVLADGAPRSMKPHTSPGYVPRVVEGA